MNDIDEDMWKKQEQINIILDYFCPSDEEVAEDNKRINSWNWFQKKIYDIGCMLDDYYVSGMLKGINYPKDGIDHFKNESSRRWAHTKIKLHEEYESKGILFDSLSDSYNVEFE